MVTRSAAFMHKVRQKIRATPRRRIWELVGVGGVLCVILLIATILTPYRTQNQSELFYAGSSASDSTTYYRATIERFVDNQPIVSLNDGPIRGAERTVNRTPVELIDKLAVGDTIIVGEQANTDVPFFIDVWRVPGLVVLVAIFVGAVLLVGRRRGAASLAGLGTSVLVLGWFIVPFIVAGHNAFWVCVAGAYMIAISSVFIAHGIRRRTVVSVVCIMFVLALVCALSAFALWLTALTGITDEAAYYLTQYAGHLDMRGIVAGGIIIATLGVLDDIVTAQVAVVEELHKANPRMPLRNLYAGAASVGREHIAALVNTLALAYAGASLPMIIQIMYNEPRLSILFNSEYIATEVVRTLVASTGLVLAVPVSIIGAMIVYRRLVKWKHD